MFGKKTYTCDLCGNKKVTEEEVKTICKMCFDNISPAVQGESMTANEVIKEIALEGDINNTTEKEEN